MGAIKIVAWEAVSGDRDGQEEEGRCSLLTEILEVMVKRDWWNQIMKEPGWSEEYNILLWKTKSQGQQHMQQFGEKNDRNINSAVAREPVVKIKWN